MGNSQFVKDVLQRVKDYYGLDTDVELADFLGVSQPTISMWKSRGSMDSDLIITKCEDASLEWVFKGKGPKKLADIDAARQVEGISPDAVVSSVPIYDQIGAGNLVYFTEIEPTEFVTVPKVLLGLYPDMYYFRVEGWSMFPTIRPKAIVGLNTAEKTITSGEIYGLWYDHEGATLKYLYTHPGKVIIRAANPEYPDAEMALEELSFNDRFIIGRMRYLCQIYE